MSSLNNQPSLDEIVSKMRDNILRTQSQASTTSITSYDNLIEQLKLFARQINESNAELKRLQELCKKNNIDVTIPPVAPKEMPKAAPKPTKP